MTPAELCLDTLVVREIRGLLGVGNRALPLRPVRSGAVSTRRWRDLLGGREIERFRTWLRDWERGAAVDTEVEIGFHEEEVTEALGGINEVGEARTST